MQVIQPGHGKVSYIRWKHRKHKLFRTIGKFDKIRSVSEGKKGEIDTTEFYALIVKLPKVPKVDISKPISSLSLWKYLNIGQYRRCNNKRKRDEYHIIASKESISLFLSSKRLNGLINYFMKSEDSRVLNIPTTIRSVKYLDVSITFFFKYM